jgi:electron transport complex protein RnfG
METQEQEPSSTRLILTLGIAGFISGWVLVSVFLFTKPIIENNKAEALKAAVFKVLPDTRDFEALKLIGGDLLPADPAEKDAELVFIGKNAEGHTTGFAISGGEAGFQDIIGVIYGYNPETKEIIGYEVLSCKETPGLGDKIFKDESFVGAFKKLLVMPEIIAVKKGEKSAPNEVEAITGATISSKAVVRLMNKSILKWQKPIEKYVEQSIQKVGDRP